MALHRRRHPDQLHLDVRSHEEFIAYVEVEDRRVDADRRRQASCARRRSRSAAPRRRRWRLTPCALASRSSRAPRVASAGRSVSASRPAGAHVVAADIDEQGAEATAELVRRAEGGEAVAVAVDVADESSVQAMVASRQSRQFGGIDVLVNNAALYAGLERKPFYELGADEWDRCWRSISRGRGCARRHASPTWPPTRRRDRQRRLRDGVQRLPALRSLRRLERRADRAHPRDGTRDRRLRRQGERRRPRVHADRRKPRSDRGCRDLRRLARRAEAKRPPDDIVGTVLFLASSASAFVTGQTVVVDGGREFI